jgi:hypothetical protein
MKEKVTEQSVNEDMSMQEVSVQDVANHRHEQDA